MPLERESCDCCGTTKTVCPECGDDFVTPRDALRLESPTHIVDYGQDDEDDDSPTTVTYVHVCWNCGWEERVTVTIERE